MEKIRRRIERLKLFLHDKLKLNDQDMVGYKIVQRFMKRSLNSGYILRRYEDHQENKIKKMIFLKYLFLIFLDFLIIYRMCLLLFFGYDYGDLFIIIGKTRYLIYTCVFLVIVFQTFIKWSLAIEECGNKLSSLWTIKEFADNLPNENLNQYLNQHFLTRKE